MPVKSLLSFMLLASVTVCAQVPPGIPRDTSFNIPATLAKEQKKRPYISVAVPVAAKQVRVVKGIVYRCLYSRELLLDVFYPRKTGRAKPAVLLIFGGGWRSGDRTHNYAMCTALANAGYVAVTADYRLSPEASYPAALYDLKSAIRWMRWNATDYGIDTNRLAVLGCSAGGQLAALLGTTNGNMHFEDHVGDHSSRVQAVIDIDGTLAFHHAESAEGAVAAQWLGGTYAEQPLIWEEAAPLSHVNAATAPILFINSSMPRFHAGRDDMIRKLDSLHIYSEVHTLDDTPHPFWFFNPWFEPMMGYILTFLAQRFR